MEILKVVPVERLSWWTAALTVIWIIAFILIMWELADGRFNTLQLGICCFIVIACTIALILLPKTYATESKTYTVEITDNSQYRRLIDDGYSIKKLYDDRDIYEISGKPLEE